MLRPMCFFLMCLPHRALCSYLVGAMDDKLLEKLAKRRLNTFSMNSGLSHGDFGWGTAAFHKMVRALLHPFAGVLPLNPATLICHPFSGVLPLDPATLICHAVAFSLRVPLFLEAVFL
jgi:Nucleotide-diphospho-sugar transferase